VVVPIEVDNSCTLCRLISGQLERGVVYEDDQVVAFMDHQPVNPGHVLVVPRHHAVLLDQLDENLSLEVYRVAHRMTRALRRSGLRCEGVNLFLADGQAAFQEVPHVHMHVFPRYHGDSFRIDADWRPWDVQSSTLLLRDCRPVYKPLKRNPDQPAKLTPSILKPTDHRSVLLQLLGEHHDNAAGTTDIGELVDITVGADAT
jgi:histidine triad (HIT) family protein